MGKWKAAGAAILLCGSFCIFGFSQADVIGDVRGQLEQNSFAAAETELRTTKRSMGLLRSISRRCRGWRGRGKRGQWDQAAGYATETRSLAEKQLAKRKLDANLICRSRWAQLTKFWRREWMRKESTPRR